MPKPELRCMACGQFDKDEDLMTMQLYAEPTAHVLIQIDREERYHRACWRVQFEQVAEMEAVRA